jgi:hypothetical protein
MRDIGWATRAIRRAFCVPVLPVAMVFGTPQAGALQTLFSGWSYPFGSATDTSVALAAPRPNLHFAHPARARSISPPEVSSQRPPNETIWKVWRSNPRVGVQ